MNRFWPFSFYLLYFAVLAAFAPYVVLYWQSQCVSGPENGMQASAQGLFGAASMGIGATLGSLLAGFLLGSAGGHVIYAVFGVSVLVGLLVLTALERGARIGRR